MLAKLDLLVHVRETTKEKSVEAKWKKKAEISKKMRKKVAPLPHTHSPP